MTADERRALLFLAALVFVSGALRLIGTEPPGPVPEGGRLDLAAHIEATRAAVLEEERRSAPLGAEERIDPNTAPASELERLPRVGAALARRIVEDRERNGRFRSVEELGRVPGVGARMTELIAPFVDLPRARAGPAGSAGYGGRALERGAVAGGTGPARRDAGTASGPAAAAPVELNGADEAALVTLPGIGPALAARIVAYRDSAGPFGSVDELVRVRGIGPATLERIRPRVRVRR